MHLPALKAAQSPKGQIAAWARQAEPSEIIAQMRKWDRELETREPGRRYPVMTWLKGQVVQGCKGQHKKQAHLAQDATMLYALAKNADSPKLLQTYISGADPEMRESIFLQILLENKNVTGENLGELTRVIAQEEVSVAEIVLISLRDQKRFDEKCDYRFLKKYGFMEKLAAQTENIDKATFNALEENWEGSLEDLIKTCVTLGYEKEGGDQ